MNRKERKRRTDIEFKDCGGLLDAFDNAVKSIWYINDEEYDYICQNATDQELNLFLGGTGKFSEKKKALSIVEKLLENMYEYRRRNYL